MYPVRRALWKILSLLLLAALLAGCSSLTTGTTTTSSATASVGTVKAITAVTSVSGSGSTLALQTVSVGWKASGTVGTVYVKPGDQVKAGDALMSIDPQSAAVSILQAQAELSGSVKALNTLLNPTAASLANAQQAVAKAQDNLVQLLTPPAASVAAAQQAVVKAQDNLDSAQTTLSNSKTVDTDYYQTQVKTAQDALTNAQQNATLTDIGSLPTQLRQAQDQLTTATNVYNNAKEAFDQCPACLKVFAYDRMITWIDAQNLYTDAVNKTTQIQLQLDQSQRSNSTSVTTAQDNLDTAQRNLDWALQGPDTVTVALNQAAVDVAQAALTDAQDNLTALLNPDETDLAVAKASLATAQENLATLLTPDPTDLVTAQARVAAAQAALDAYTLRAPVAGEVLVVNYQSGDTASAAGAAITLGNRSHVRVEIQVDESDIGKIQLSDPVTITVDALPDVTLAGLVTWINPTGATSSGLVKYTVRVDTTEANAQVLLGMTASALIVTDTQNGALAVPLAAVQYDTQGEYVNLVQADGSLSRVPVVSGQIQSGLVLVAGNLKDGDQVSLISATTTTTTASATAGGAGGLGALSGGGPGEPPSGGAPQP